MVTISFKVSEDEALLIRARAREEGVSVSEYLRRRAGLDVPGSGRSVWSAARKPAR